MIRFNCPSCGMKLKADDEYAASTINCPGCNSKLQVPASLAAREAESQVATGGETGEEEPERSGWVETDPANPNVWVALGLGLGIMTAILLLGWVFKKPLPYVYAILYQRGWVNFAETFAFSWGIGILILKVRKLQHQRNALLLDVLPSHLGQEINRDNVRVFIDHIYALPVHLRDSLMVNRLRKGLELFQTRQVNADVATMMANQSNIDSVRISGSYALLKAFIWVVPILGFVGTVLGLSVAIGNFQGVMGGAKDVDALMSSLSGVTGGLATAFDTTLLGLIYSIIMSIPMSALQKVEDDNLNTIDAYCNEILLPRLNDGANVAGGDMGGLLNTLTQALGQAQGQFLTGLDNASVLIRQQSENLERRAREHQAVVEQNFSRTVTTLQKDTAQAMENTMNTVSHTLAGLEAGIHSLNKALKELGERQIIIQRQSNWWGRLFGKG